MYSNYQQYQQRGGKLPEAEYLAKAQAASEVIDYYTMGQAQTATDMTDKISACECALVDCMQTGGDMPPSIQSESNDGYSVTFKTQAEQDAVIQKTLSIYLTAPRNLIAVCGHAYV